MPKCAAERRRLPASRGAAAPEAAAPAAETPAARSASAPASSIPATVPGQARPAAAVAETEHEREHEPEEAGADGEPERLRDDPRDAARDAAGCDRTQGAAKDGAQDRRSDEHHEEQDRQDAADSLGTVPMLLRLRQRLAIDDGDHALDAGRNAAREVALAKARRDDLVDDAVGGEIRQCALETAADLDAKRAVLHRDQEQRTVVRLLAPELPGVDHADRVLLDLFRLRGRDDQHRNLRAFPRLEVRELRLEARALRARQGAGEVGDARCERRNRLRGLRHRGRRYGNERDPRRGDRGTAQSAT